MSYPIEFLEDFATFKKGDKTDSISGDIVSALKKRGIVNDFKNIITVKKSKDKHIGNSEEAKVKSHWKVTVSEVEKVETLEDLKPFEADERKAVIKAVAEKKLELETI